MQERDPLPHTGSFTGSVDEDAIETAGITGTDAPSADSGAPAIEEVMRSQTPGTLPLDFAGDEETLP